MTSMREALIELTVMRDATDEQIVHKIGVIHEKEKELTGLKEGLRILQDRSASLSKTIAFVQVGVQNDGIDPLKIQLSE